MPSRRDIIKQSIAAGLLFGLPKHLGGLTPPIGSTARPHLDTALRAERWIRGARQATADGARWPADPLTPGVVSTDLYNGMAGVVVFYLELFAATGDQAHLREATAGADYLISRIPSIPAVSADSAGARVRSPECGLYTGLAGTAYVLERTASLSGQRKYRDAMTRCLDLVQRLARPAGTGVEWNDSTDIVSGSAGIGLELLHAYRATGNDALLGTARRAGTRLIERARPEAEGGLSWLVTPTFPRNMPNFSHGTAGVAYFLARLHEETRDSTYLQAAIAGARYLEAIATRKGDASLIHHHDPDGKDLFYLSWCHGPAGTARLFHQLARTTKDGAWLEPAHRLARGITTMTPIPEERTPGFWNNISQCCGNIGVAQFFLDLHRTSGDVNALAFARRNLADTLRRATEVDGGLKWVQAENRTQPDNLVAQTGFMQGAAGVGTFLLHLDAFEQKRARAIVFPDSPFVA
jgi:lantibiotic modifying enzyme